MLAKSVATEIPIKAAGKIFSFLGASFGQMMMQTIVRIPVSAARW